MFHQVVVDDSSVLHEFDRSFELAVVDRVDCLVESLLLLVLGGFFLPSFFALELPVGDLSEGLGDANGRIDGVDKDLQDSKETITAEIQRVTNSVSALDELRQAAEAALQGSIDDLEFDLTGLREIIVGVTAYIKSGLIYTTDAGIPVYGIEIGQEVESNGTQVFNKFARFTSEKLSFYDANSNEVAYISDKKLYIGQAEITISFKVGGLIDLVLANGDVVTKWEGGS